MPLPALPTGLMGGSPFTGTITVANWTMAPDGETYMHFFAPRWVIMPDRILAELLGLGRFRTTEGWCLVGYGLDATEPLMWFPGCQVKAWTKTSRAPNHRNVFDLRGIGS